MWRDGAIAPSPLVQRLLFLVGATALERITAQAIVLPPKAVLWDGCVCCHSIQFEWVLPIGLLLVCSACIVVVCAIVVITGVHCRICSVSKVSLCFCYGTCSH
jgi:hypothetical protein